MELISEEELSVCRSEGSPPRKKPKGNKERAAQELKKKTTIYPVPIGTNAKQNKAGSTLTKSEKGLKLKPEKAIRQRGMSVAPDSSKSQLMQDDESMPRKRTLSQLYNAIKKPIQSSTNKHEGDSDLELDNELFTMTKQDNSTYLVVDNSTEYTITIRTESL